MITGWHHFLSVVSPFEFFFAGLIDLHDWLHILADWLTDWSDSDSTHRSATQHSREHQLPVLTRRYTELCPEVTGNSTHSQSGSLFPIAPNPIVNPQTESESSQGRTLSTAPHSFISRIRLTDMLIWVSWAMLWLNRHSQKTLRKSEGTFWNEWLRSAHTVAGSTRLKQKSCLSP